jgi:hypothetical protein
MRGLIIVLFSKWNRLECWDLTKYVLDELTDWLIDLCQLGLDVLYLSH